MDYSGTWKVYSEENLGEFLKEIGAPEMVVKMRQDTKPVVVIEQNGKSFTHTMKCGLVTKSHSFTLGEETEITTLDGRKVKCTTTEENGKLVVKSDKFTCVREIQGDDLVETFTTGSVTFISKSKRA